MLLNPEWFKKVKTEASLDGMIEFIKTTKDPNEKYQFSDSNNCACAQYYRSIGRDFREEWSTKGDLTRYEMASFLNNAVGFSIENKYTWGAALERACHHKKIGTEPGSMAAIMFDLVPPEPAVMASATC